MKKDISIAIILIIFTLATVHIISKNVAPVQKEKKVQVDTTNFKPVIIREYGLAIDSFIVLKGKIKRNQNLSEILAKYNVPDTTIHRIAEKSKEIFDLRKIRYGNKYTAFCNNDSLNTLKYFVYEHTPVEYIIFEISDSIRVDKKEKEVVTVKKTASGTINTSLWNTIIDNNLSPMMAIELSEIYAWSIDFFGLQKGDKFKVIYEESRLAGIDSQSIGLGKIYGAYFNHAGKDFYAIPFMQDSVESYFDEEGNSLRRSFLKAPLRFSRISSRYSKSRFHPILRIRRPHLGVDYAAPSGTPVQAVGDGVIIKAGYYGGAGRMVKIKHNSVYTTAYLHLSRFTKQVKVGAYVKQRDIIGFVGSSGLSTGPHLDFRFWRNGHPVDPLKVEAPPVEPIKDENIVEYNKIMKITIKKLKNITL